MASAIAQIVAHFHDAPPAIRHYSRWKLRLDPVYVAVDHEVPRRAHVLDLGAGLGLLGQWLTRVAAERVERTVLGVEWDAAKVAHGARAIQGSASTLVEGDVTKLDSVLADDARFDAVTLVDLLHYFDVETQRTILAGAVSRLNDEGTLLIRDGSGGTLGARWTEWLERIAVKIGWNRSAREPRWLSFEALRAQLEGAGMTVTVRSLSGPLHPGNALLVARLRGHGRADS